MVRHLLFGYQSDLEAAVNSWAVSKLLFWRLVNYWLLLLAYICSVKHKDFYTIFFQSWLAKVLENLWYKIQDFQMGTKKLRGQHKSHLTYPNHLYHGISCFSIVSIQNCQMIMKSVGNSKIQNWSIIHPKLNIDFFFYKFWMNFDILFFCIWFLSIFTELFTTKFASGLFPDNEIWNTIPQWFHPTVTFFFTYITNVLD